MGRAEIALNSQISAEHLERESPSPFLRSPRGWTVRVLGLDPARRPSRPITSRKRREGSIGSSRPFPPVRRTHLNSLLCVSVDPTAKNATAREHQGMWPIIVDDRQFEIAVERSARYRLPLLHHHIVNSLDQLSLTCVKGWIANYALGGSPLMVVSC